MSKKYFCHLNYFLCLFLFIKFYISPCEFIKTECESIDGQNVSLINRYFPYKEKPCEFCLCMVDEPMFCIEQKCEVLECFKNPEFGKKCCQKCRGTLYIIRNLFK